MHPVQNRISPWAQKGRTLGYIGESKKEFLPEFTHHKHAMSSVAMKKKCLRKQRQIPVKDEEEDNNHLKIKKLN
jgi:hypothetical protein